MAMPAKGKEPAADKIMSPGEMKPLLALSKREPVFAAIGITADGDGVILLDKKKKAKKCLALLKAAAAKEKIQLQPSTLRFGKAEVDTEYDAGMVRFFVNKDPPGNMRIKLVELVKRIPYQKVEINVDASFETELDEDPAALTALLNQLKAEIPQVANGNAGLQTSLDALATAAQASLTENNLEQAVEGIEALRKALEVAPRPTSAPPPPPPGGPAPPTQPALDATKLEQALAQLTTAIPKVAATDAALQQSLVALAMTAQGSLKAKDLAKASEGIEALRRALGEAMDAAKLKAGIEAGGGTVTYAKSRLAWLAARKKVESDIETLRQRIVDTFKDDPIAPQLETSYKTKVAPVLATLDERLADKLDEATNATDAAKRTTLVGEAKAIMQEYAQYLTSESLIKDLDENPFVPLSIRATVGGTISTLSKAIH